MTEFHATSESDREAAESQEELKGLVERILAQHEDLAGRLNDIELRSVRCDYSSTHRISGLDQDGSSTIKPSDEVRRSMFQTFQETPRFTFEGTLEDSRVYKRVRRDDCDVSFRSSVARSHAWSQLSGISLAQISAISVIALPILPTEIASSQLYTSGSTRAVQAMNPSKHVVSGTGSEDIKMVRKCKACRQPICYQTACQLGEFA